MASAPPSPVSPSDPSFSWRPIVETGVSWAGAGASLAWKVAKIGANLTANVAKTSANVTANIARWAYETGKEQAIQTAANHHAVQARVLDQALPPVTFESTEKEQIKDRGWLVVKSGQ